MDVGGTHTSVGVQCVQCACTTWCVCEELVGHVSQRQDGDHAVVAVGFDEVVASDGGRVDVVLPEWTDKRLEEDRKGRGGVSSNRKPFQNNVLRTSCNDFDVQQSRCIFGLKHAEIYVK